MSTDQWSLVIGGGQLLVALLIWAGLDMKAIRKLWPDVKEMNLSRSKLILVLILGGLVFSGYGFFQSRVVTHALPAPESGTQIIEQKNFIPDDPRWTSGLRVTVATDKNRGPVQILVICDGDIGLAPNAGKSPKSGQFLVESQMLLTGHPEVWNVKWRIPQLTPDDPVTFEFLSKKEIHAKWTITINYNPNVY